MEMCRQVDACMRRHRCSSMRLARPSVSFVSEAYGMLSLCSEEGTCMSISSCCTVHHHIALVCIGLLHCCATSRQAVSCLPCQDVWCHVAPLPRYIVCGTNVELLMALSLITMLLGHNAVVAIPCLLMFEQSVLPSYVT